MIKNTILIKVFIIGVLIGSLIYTILINTISGDMISLLLYDAPIGSINSPAGMYWLMGSIIIGVILSFIFYKISE